MPRLNRNIGIMAALGACLSLLLAAPAARAVDRIYWTNSAASPNNKVSWANLDGSGGGDLDTTGATVSGATGVAIDPASGRIYWANSAVSLGIFFANLSGGGGGSLSTSGATLGSFQDLAIRPAAPANPLARMYWTRESPDGISFARQDGMGDGGNLSNLGFSVVDDPRGVAIRPTAAAGRGVIYWANSGTVQPGISTALLDDSDNGQPLLTSGATVDDPFGVAINEASGRAYWSNIDNAGSTNDGISFTNIDGTGMGGDLDISGASINNPTGVAIDPDEGRIYWLNTGAVTGVSFANLTGGGGGDLNVSGATTGMIARFAALLKAPKGTGAPQLGGGSTVGSLLSCTVGSWAGDLYESRLYRAPASFSFQWSRDGVDIPGATSSSLVAAVAGAYACRVAATNHAGTTTQTSSSHAVSESPATLPNDFKLGKLRKNKKKGIAFLAVSVPGPGELGLAGKGVQGIGGAGIAGKSLAVSGGQTRLKIAPAKGKQGRKVRRKLRSQGKARLNVRVTYVPTGGIASSQRRKVKLVKK